MKNLHLSLGWRDPRNPVEFSRTLIQPLQPLAAAFVLLLLAAPALAADTNSPPAASPPAVAAAVPAPKKLSKTVGLDIAKKTVNPDKTVSLLFKWNDKGRPMERTVTINDDTIVVYNGKLRKFADLTDEELRAKAVATVGDDDVTAVVLRFGKTPVPKDQLTPAQAARLASLVPKATTASDEAINKRATGIVDALDLKDHAKQERIRAVIATDLRAVRDTHNAGLQLDEAVHKQFIAGLQADLTPDQIELVKDRLTVNKVPVTFKVYHQIIANLTAEDDVKILGWLKKAREESLYVKNVEDMNPIFKKYKREIEPYLDSRGYNWAKSYKAFVDGQKATK